MSEDYTAEVSYANDDGYVVAVITGPDGYRFSYSLRHDHASQWVAQELAILNGPQGECPHGLDAALCSGPNHY